jgi:hypothetical protein
MSDISINKIENGFTVSVYEDDAEGFPQTKSETFYETVDGVCDAVREELAPVEPAQPE